jgi:hypothetical protein
MDELSADEGDDESAGVSVDIAMIVKKPMTFACHPPIQLQVESGTSQTTGDSPAIASRRKRH